MWQTFGIMFACAETHDGKEWTTHHEVDISYAGRVIAIKKSIDVTDVPGDVMEAAEAAGASACTSYWYELMHDIYELDECAGGEHYEVDTQACGSVRHFKALRVSPWQSWWRAL